MQTVMIHGQSFVRVLDHILIDEGGQQRWAFPCDAREAAALGTVTPAVRSAASPPHPTLGPGMADPPSPTYTGPAPPDFEPRARIGWLMA